MYEITLIYLLSYTPRLYTGYDKVFKCKWTCVQIPRHLNRENQNYE